MLLAQYLNDQNIQIDQFNCGFRTENEKGNSLKFDKKANHFF